MSENNEKTVPETIKAAFGPVLGYTRGRSSLAATAGSKQIAKDKVNAILQTALSRTDKTLILDGRYIRWGLVEKRIMQVIDDI